MVAVEISKRLLVLFEFFICWFEAVEVEAVEVEAAEVEARGAEAAVVVEAAVVMTARLSLLDEVSDPAARHPTKGEGDK